MMLFIVNKDQSTNYNMHHNNEATNGQHNVKFIHRKVVFVYGPSKRQEYKQESHGNLGYDLLQSRNDIEYE
jgi:hypothetical protein